MFLYKPCNSAFSCESILPDWNQKNEIEIEWIIAVHRAKLVEVNIETCQIEWIDQPSYSIPCKSEMM